MLDELPSETTDELFSGYLFRPFLSKYALFFRVPINSKSTYFSANIAFVPSTFYNWGHQAYRDFMMRVLQSLQPRRADAGTILMGEMEECLEIFFTKKGTISAGFEVNKIRQIGLKWECDQDKGACVVGGYNCTFF